MESIRRMHICVSGLVQGVFYRARTVEVAQSLGLTGWVRNLADGRVEIVAEGEEESLRRLLKWCHEGPPAARVEQVRVEEESATGEYRGFSVRY